MSVAKNCSMRPLGCLDKRRERLRCRFLRRCLHRDGWRILGRGEPGGIAGDGGVAAGGSWMVALSEPIVDLFRGGRSTGRMRWRLRLILRFLRFRFRCGRHRGFILGAFYAAGNTVTPAIAGWVITLVSIPVYACAVSPDERGGAGGGVGYWDVAEYGDAGGAVASVSVGESGVGWSMASWGGRCWQRVLGFAGTAWCVGRLHLPRGYRGDCDFDWIRDDGLGWDLCGGAARDGVEVAEAVAAQGRIGEEL